MDYGKQTFTLNIKRHFIANVIKRGPQCHLRHQKAVAYLLPRPLSPLLFPSTFSFLHCILTSPPILSWLGFTTLLSKPAFLPLRYLLFPTYFPSSLSPKCLGLLPEHHQYQCTYPSRTYFLEIGDDKRL